MKFLRKFIISLLLLSLTSVLFAQDGISVDDVLTGSLGESNPRGQYTLSGIEDETVTVTLRSSDFDAYLVVLGPEGQELFVDDDSAGDLDSRLVITFPQTADYTVIVTSLREYRSGGTFYAEGDYTIEVISGGEVAPVQEEPTQVPPTAPPPTPVPPATDDGGEVVSAEGAIEGTLTEDNPRGVYTFSGEAGETVTISLTSSDFDAYLVVLGPNGDELAVDDDSAGQLNAVLTMILPESGEYTVIATSLREYRSDGGFVAVGDFVLTMSGGQMEQGDMPPQDATAAPPQEMTPTPTPLPAPPTQTPADEGASIGVGDKLEGELTFNQPFKDYSFTASDGDVVTITLIAEDFDAYLILFDANGGQVMSDDDGAGNLNARIGPFEILADGTYTIRATSFSHEVGDEPIPGSFSLTLAAAILTPIEYSQSISGTISNEEPVAVYQFRGNLGDVITIDLQTQSESIYMEIDSNDYLLFEQSYGGSSVLGPITLPESANYNITVTSYDEAGDYTLVVRRLEAQEINFNEPVVANFDDAVVQYYSFDGRAGESINVHITSGGRVDTQLAIIAPDGSELLFDDDGGTGFDPEALGVVLPEDGVYSLIITPYIVGDNGNFSVLVVPSSAVSLEDEAQIVRISDKQFEGVVVFEGKAAEVVRLSVVILAGAENQPRVIVEQNGVQLADNPIGLVKRLLLEFETPADGPVQVRIVSDYYEPAVVELSLERLAE